MTLALCVEKKMGTSRTYVADRNIPSIPHPSHENQDSKRLQAHFITTHDNDGHEEEEGQEEEEQEEEKRSSRRWNRRRRIRRKRTR